MKTDILTSFTGQNRSDDISIAIFILSPDNAPPGINYVLKR